LATGEFIKFAHDDDVLEPSNIERAIKCFLKYPTVTMVVNRRELINDKNSSMGKNIWWLKSSVFEDSFIEGYSAANLLVSSQMNFLVSPLVSPFGNVTWLIFSLILPALPAGIMKSRAI